MSRKHGRSGTPTWQSWNSMRRRCGDPKRWNFKYYGGRGIKVCERWQKFENFLADMGERPAGSTLDRIDNERDYEPSNCRWLPRSQQSANRRPFRKWQREKTHCRDGHAYSGDNLRLTTEGHRKCRACHAASEARRRARRKLAA